MKDIKEIVKKKEEILNFTPSKALKTILDDDRSVALIRSFSDEELYFLMNEIGVEDFLPILHNASNSQWEYILDISIWKKDRVDNKKLGIWLHNLFESFKDRFCNYIVQEKLELAELYFSKTVEVGIRDEDDDPSNFLQEGAITFDDTFYIRAKGKDKKAFEILKYLAKYNYEKYQKIIFELLSIIGSEAEEENYRLKSARLSEKGFLQFDEAATIFKIMEYSELKASKRNKPNYGFAKKAYYRKENNIILNAFDQIDDENIITEFAFLSNQMASFLGSKIKTRDDVRKITSKISSTLKIACEAVAKKENKKLDENFIIHLFKIYPLSYLFRFGYSSILKLRNRANRWLKVSWFKKEAKLTLNFWGEKNMGILGGIFLPQPLFFTNREQSLYKDFSSLKEIEYSEKKLDEIVTIDKMFSLLNPKIEKVPFLTYKALILTLWARKELNIKTFSIPFQSFQLFFKELFTDKGEIKKDANISFLNFIEKETSIKSNIFDNFLKNEIEEEYKEVSKEKIERRFVKNFIIDQS